VENSSVDRKACRFSGLFCNVLGTVHVDAEVNTSDGSTCKHEFHLSFAHMAFSKTGMFTEKARKIGSFSYLS
jgi:hypothetical protein